MLPFLLVLPIWSTKSVPQLCKSREGFTGVYAAVGRRCQPTGGAALWWPRFGLISVGMVRTP